MSFATKAGMVFAAGLMAQGLDACTAFDSPFIVHGNTACAGPQVTPGKCEELDRIGQTLHAAAVVTAICAAGADTAECK